MPTTTLDITDSIDVLYRSDFERLKTHVQLKHDIPKGLTVTPEYLCRIERAWDRLHLAAEAFHDRPLNVEVEETFRQAVEEFNAVMDGR